MEEGSTQISKGHITLSAATEIANTQPSAERQQMINEVSEAANKKLAERVVGRRKPKKNTRQTDFGNLKMPDLSGRYNILLAVIENMQKLPQELRGLERAPYQLSGNMAQTLKIALEGLKKLDFDELLAAADAAIKELDRVINRGAADAHGQEAPADSAKNAGTDATDLSAATWGTRIGGLFRGGN